MKKYVEKCEVKCRNTKCQWNSKDEKQVCELKQILIANNGVCENFVESKYYFKIKSYSIL